MEVASKQAKEEPMHKPNMGKKQYHEKHLI
jgi:hypothetical protein